MGSNTIIAIVVGAILVIVGFALWPVLNGASNSLYSYFQNSCISDSENGYRFGKVYIGDDSNPLPSPLNSGAYYTASGIHGGSGFSLAEDTGATTANVVIDDCQTTITLVEDLDATIRYTVSGLNITITAISDTDKSLELYNEYGDLVADLVVTLGLGGTLSTFASTDLTGLLKLPKGTQVLIEERTAAAGGRIDITPPPEVWEAGGTVASLGTPVTTNGDPVSSVSEWSEYDWVKVAPMLDRFAGINNLLLTVIPVV